MKKFIIAICGVMLAGGAIGADPEHYQEPFKKTFNSDIWKAFGLEYNDSLDSSLYSDLNKQIGKISNTTRGTHSDDGAVVLIIARDIYEHGGNFCMTQIQAANENGYRYTWLEYYDYPSKYLCEPLCIPGYYGTGCKQEGIADTCNTSELDFGEYVKKTSGEWNDRITTDVKVFRFDNSVGGSDTTTAKHRVLAVTKRMSHGVIVQPVEIVGERYQSGTGDGKYSYIKSVHSNGQDFLLCAEGYKANNDRTDCIFADELVDKCEFESRRFCEGFSESNFKSDQHAWDIDPDENCNYFVCKAGSDYAFEKQETKNCKKCATTRKQGIKDGVCVQCHDDEVFNNGSCDKYKQLSKHDLLDGFHNIGKCWMKSDPSEYKNCVLCPSGQTYNDEAKTCQ